MSFKRIYIKKFQTMNNNQKLCDNNNLNKCEIVLNLNVGASLNKRTTDFSIDSILGNKNLIPKNEINQTIKSVKSCNYTINNLNKIKQISESNSCGSGNFEKNRPFNKILSSPWISASPILYNPDYYHLNQHLNHHHHHQHHQKSHLHPASSYHLNNPYFQQYSPLNFPEKKLENFVLSENEKFVKINEEKLKFNKNICKQNNLVHSVVCLDKDQEIIYSCKICDKVFGCAFTLESHEKAHRTPRYECEECGKGFSQLRNYKYHISVHRGTKEFAAECPECGKMFNDKGYLSSHLKIHRNRKEYACPHCPKSFNQRVAFNMHVRIHTGVKPHKCPECGKRFSRKMLLKQHSRTHSGEKPYQCSVCGKTFADRSNMTLHHKLHSGIKPFACPICPKAFTKKHHLKTHINYHTGCKPYICPHPNCGQAFTQSSNMRTHSKKCQMKPIQLND